MRDLVLQMMTTVNGRIDDPDAWATSVPADLHAELDRLYATFDTILVGRTTYEEMLEYWPGAETNPEGSDTSRSMARKMNAYKKYVFTGTGEGHALEWNNAETVPVEGDDDILGFVNELKAQSGGDIHLAGGAALARSLVRLGLVDQYRLFVYPVTSPGLEWFGAIDEQREMELVSATAFSNGVAGLHYTPVGD